MNFLFFYLFQLAAFLFDALIIYFFYKRIFKAKYDEKFSAKICILIFLTGYVLSLFFLNPLYTLIFGFISSFSFSVIAFNTKIKSSFIAALYTVSLNGFTRFLTTLIFSSFTEMQSRLFAEGSFENSFCLLLSKILLFALISVSAKYGFRLSEDKSIEDPMYLLALPTLSLSMLYFMYENLIQKSANENIYSAVIITSTVLITFSLSVFLFYGKTLSKLKELYAYTSETEKSKTDIAYYSVLNIQTEQLNKILHDEKNHLSTIKSLSNSKDIEKYIDTVYGEIAKFSLIGNTENKALDLTVNKYTCICNEKSIDFNVNIKTSNLNFMSDTDLISFMGNILDNAVEAAEKSKEKRIQLSVNKSKGFDVVTCINACDREPIKHNGKFISAKQDSYAHGYGIKIISDTVKKYDGDITLNYNEDKNQFETVVIFNPR